MTIRPQFGSWGVHFLGRPRIQLSGIYPEIADTDATTCSARIAVQFL
jgi:hypothetical protein